MLIMPMLFPIVFIVMLIAAVFKGTNEPFRQVHYWFICSLIGIAIYVGFNYGVSVYLSHHIPISGK